MSNSVLGCAIVLVLISQNCLAFDPEKWIESAKRLGLNPQEAPPEKRVKADSPPKHLMRVRPKSATRQTMEKTLKLLSKPPFIANSVSKGFKRSVDNLFEAFPAASKSTVNERQTGTY